MLKSILIGMSVTFAIIIIFYIVYNIIYRIYNKYIDKRLRFITTKYPKICIMVAILYFAFIWYMIGNVIIQNITRN